MPKKLQKLICVVGQTASGKSDLAVKIALRLGSEQAKKLALSKTEGFNGGEVISADSRQVYRGMDIGTGKITKQEMRGIPHWLLDVASPKIRFDVAQYKKLAEKAIEKISAKEKTPIICGGTGFYIRAIVDDLQIPKVAPDWKLRKKMEKKSAAQLFKILGEIDPNRAKNIDAKNPRRLIRAIEIVKKTGKPVPKLKIRPKFDTLFIGIEKSPQELKKRIKKRLVKRLRQGMIAEVKKLHQNGVSWKRLDDFGLEYRWISRYLQGKLSKKEMIEKLQKDIENYAKRQMTWFKKDKRIHWIKSYGEAEKLINSFLIKK